MSCHLSQPRSPRRSFTDPSLPIAVAAMQKSAASLTGAMGTSLKQQAIPAVGKRSVSVAKAAAKEAERRPAVVQAARKEPKGGKALTSKEKLLAENAAKK